MNRLYDDIISKKATIAVVGLGYVGMPIAVAFSKKVNVIGFDISEAKVSLYRNGIDPTKEVGDEEIRKSSVEFTSDSSKLSQADFIIVAVPTPVNSDTIPDLTPVISACELIGKNMKRNSVVVFESTVYPGVTEEECIPVLEKESGLKFNEDFYIGYSPERINPGDKVHTLENIVKVVSGSTKETLDLVAKVYELVVDAGVHKAPSIKVAEASKVIENSQRDLNIAFMNELSMIFNNLGIDTQEVLKAAGTKWNFLNFTPGLVGGHCIGVDPYYLTYKAERTGYHSQVILSGRRLNANMSKYITENILKKMIKQDISVKKSKIGILGFTFKENCPDTRNTRVIEIYDELREYGVSPLVYDPEADKGETFAEYGIKLVDFEELTNLDVVIIAVGHNQFINMNAKDINDLMVSGNKLLIDIKGIFDKQSVEDHNIAYWSL